MTLSAIKKVVIVGGVAGGANAAARLRRLREDLEIVIFERSGYVSFANCGLPYHIGGEISAREKLLLHTPETLRSRFNLDVRILSEVVAVDRENKLLTVREYLTTPSSAANLSAKPSAERALKREYTESYDVLILAPGAAPFRPAIPGLELEGIFSLRNVEDMDSIISSIKHKTPRNILIVGGGFIGLEMLEQLHHRFSASGSQLSLIEMNPHILAPLDYELVSPIERHIEEKGVRLILGDAVKEFIQNGDSLIALTKAGLRIEADFVLFNIGVRAEATLAEQAGLKLGSRGGVLVDSQYRSSDPAIFAVGDCIETKNIITNEEGITPLAGPANRQGRKVADIIAALPGISEAAKEKGVLGTAIVRVFELTAAITGPNERTLKRLNIPYRAVHLQPNSHAGYYPGAQAINLKLLYSPDTRKLLAAQAVGREGIDKRIDVMATALYAGLSIDDLIELELCYAPPFGSAKDPINLSGMIAQNIENKLVETIYPEELERELQTDSTLLDVRTVSEYSRGHIPGSLNIPLAELRQRLAEIPREKQVLVYCQSGQRAYTACRVLSQNSYRAKNLSGAYINWRNQQAEQVVNRTDK